MRFRFVVIVIIVVFVICTPWATASVYHQCRCGGRMLNGKAPSGCFNGRCTVRNDATYCATVFANDTAPRTVIALACLTWSNALSDCSRFKDGSYVCVCKPGSTCYSPQEKSDRPTSTSLASITSSSSVTSGATVQLSTKGLDLAMQILQKRVDELRSVQIPDEKFSAYGFKARVFNLRVTEFTPPNFGYQLVAPSTVTLVSSSGYLRIDGKWQVKKFLLSMSGHLKAITKHGLSSTVGLTFITTPDGQLRVALASCNFRIDIDLNFGGGMPGIILNFLSKGMEHSLSTLANRKLCELLQQTIDEKVNPSLSTIPWNYRFDHNYVLDYRLVNGGFDVAPNLIQSFFLGMVKWEDQPTSAVQPSAYVPFETSAKMGYAYISDFVPNTYLYVAQSRNQLTYDFGEKDVAEKDRKYFRTTCTGEGIDTCIGSKIKELGLKYPNGTIEFRLKSNSPPAFKITATSVKLTGQGLLELVVVQNPQQSITVAMGNLHFDARCSPIVDAAVKPPILKGSATVDNLSVLVTNSSISQITTDYIQAFLDVGSTALQIVLNKGLVKGVKLPLPNMRNIVNLEVHLIDNAIVTSFDVTI